MRAGAPDQATTHATEALALARRTGDRGQTARGAATVALLAAARGDLDEARARGEEAAALAEPLGDAATRARALRALAMAGTMRGAFDAALGAAQDAVRLARQLGDDVELGLGLRLLGALHARLSGVDLAAAARSARAQAPQTANDGGEEASIDALIEGALLDADASVPPEVATLDAAARAHLDAAADAYAGALGALDTTALAGERVRTLREMARVVAARGELARADVLLDRAAALEQWP
jgi:hypothetical protein